jgi:glycosyltransferase involved in cell wall biosynthesis
MKKNDFSVLMAVYYKDDPKLLQIALHSVYTNTLKPDQVVLVQDGPIGANLTAVVDMFAHRDDFLLIKLDINKGLANALNEGMKYITTTYVFRADSDDFNLPERFEMQFSKLLSGYDLVGGAVMEVDRLGHQISIKNVPIEQPNIKKFLSRRNPFNHMTVAYRRDAVIELGGYPDIFLKEDYALWAKMVAAGYRIINLDQVLVNATAGSDMYKRRGGVNYVISEIHLQRFLLKTGVQTIVGAFFWGTLRSLVFLFPSFLRGVVYEKLLRKSI